MATVRSDHSSRVAAAFAVITESLPLPFSPFPASGSSSCLCCHSMGNHARKVDNSCLTFFGSFQSAQAQSFQQRQSLPRPFKCIFSASSTICWCLCSCMSIKSIIIIPPIFSTVVVLQFLRQLQGLSSAPCPPGSVCRRTYPIDINCRAPLSCLLTGILRFSQTP